MLPAAVLAVMRPRHLAAMQAVQTFNGPMADANEVYRPVTLAPKPGASPSMTDAERDDLAHKLHCQCGCNLDVYTCRTTDFACSVSPAMHADVLGLVSGGYGAQEILSAFKAVYGEKVLMAPGKSGFNLLGYTMPFVVLAAGATLVLTILKRWKARAPETAPVSAAIDATDDELAALDAAVRRDG